MSESQAVRPDHLPVLDAWRGMAIAFLLLGHFAVVPKVNCGRLGVEFFFVLSGFLMGRLLFLKRTPLGRFYRRRISRIFPAAYAFLGIMTALGLAGLYWERPNRPGSAACYLFYVNYYTAFRPNAFLGLPAGHFWSLCVEEHAYVFLSGLALVHRRLGVSPAVLLGVGIALIFGNAARVGRATGWDYYQTYWRSDCRASSILCGALACYLGSRGVGGRPRYLGVPAPWVAAGVTLLGIALNFQKVPDFAKYTVGSATLAAGLLLVSQHGLGRLGTARALTWLGTVSYSLYLWQQPFFDGVVRGAFPRGPALAGALAAGLASYALIESPARRWLNARWAG